MQTGVECFVLTMGSSGRGFLCFFLFWRLGPPLTLGLDFSYAMKKLLIKIAKIAGILIGIAVAVIGVLWCYYYIHEELPKKKINITVMYTPDEVCSKEYPMAVVIKNDSSRVIYETSFDIMVRRKGYSRDLAKLSYNHYSTDKIIHPGESHAACWTYPELGEENVDKYDRKELIYEIGYKSVKFGD